MGRSCLLGDFIPESMLRKCTCDRRLQALFSADLLLGLSKRMLRSLVRCVPQLCSQVGSRQKKESKCELGYFVRW